ncbi:MAG: hypothetical protein ACM3L8_04240 [Verrucomicrobiota bacterium]
MPPAKKPVTKVAPRKAAPRAQAPEAAPRRVADVLQGKPSQKAARDMLILETRRLRALFSEIAERYLAETEGRIASAVQAVETSGLPADKIEGMLAIVQGVAVKPQKGRRKDLARIEKAAEKLLRVLEE